MTDTIDTALRTAVERGDLVGVAAAAGTADGTTYEGAFGTRGADQSAAMTTDTVMWIASMTKAITTVAALQQVETGRLSLDEPVGGLVPELAYPQVLTGVAVDGEPRVRPASRPITLRHLLTHTAGFGYEFFNSDLLTYMAARDVPSAAEGRRASLAMPLVHDPGDEWEYGINIDFAGLVVEAATGRRLDAVLADDVLGPLGMVDTAFRIGDDQRSRLASMHARTEDGSLVAMPFEVAQEPEFHMGGGGLYGTVADYLRFCRMWLNDGTLDGARILSADMVAEATRDHIAPLTVRPFTSALAMLTNDLELLPGISKGWGLSFMINHTAVPGGRAAGSLAWAGLANTYYWIDRESDVAGVVATQVLPFGDPAALETLAAFEQSVYGAKSASGSASDS